MSLNSDMKKLLVPLDGSKFGETALPWAKFLAEKKAASLELLRCYRALSAVYTFPDFATPPPVSYDLSGFIRLSEKYLHSCVKEYQLEGATVSVKEGEPADTILQQSEAEDVEAILLSSHGSGGFGRWLLGSVVTQVVRGSQKPVYILKAQDEEPVQPKLGKILVCLDGSKYAESALQAAAALAPAFDAEITLYRGVEFNTYPVLAYQISLEQQEKLCLEYLEELKLRYPDLKITTKVQVTPVVNGILAECEKHDLAVLSAHGYGGFERWLLGSTTEKVLHRAKSPLLVVRGPAEQA